MKIKLDDNISSPQDLQDVISEIRNYARWSSHSTVKKLLGSKKLLSEPPDMSLAAKNILKNYLDKNLRGRSGLDQLISALEHLVRYAPQISITLAAPPTNSVKKLLVAWCRDNITPSILVKFEYRSNLLGGMVVRCGSHIYDWSFRRQILVAGQSFPEVLRHV